MPRPDSNHVAAQLQTPRQASGAVRGDAVVRRHIAQWRRVTARLQVMLNANQASAELVSEARSLQRHCQNLAASLGDLIHREGRR